MRVLRVAPVRFASKGQGADALVGEVGEPERGSFDAFDQVVGGLSRGVGGSGGVPVRDRFSPAHDGAA